MLAYCRIDSQSSVLRLDGQGQQYSKEQSNKPDPVRGLAMVAYAGLDRKTHGIVPLLHNTILYKLFIFKGFSEYFYRKLTVILQFKK
ncbi:MAG: hypothetical protein PsegKO_35440 [Pseudohongiellaceae bacterium]